ncbi:MAG: hypothetical protein BJ554DRAFT_6233 [Olpidium bornovanus]|uniref:Uncharacterized protein n=1 Tax=Olpidium bornovanus TaxID=278681 RepID=A0A8H7ZY99_9FUNG|nr:MAG: hypothetical protein BJ554DRAFT_6233 [Olpidium bornovanus]
MRLTAQRAIHICCRAEITKRICPGPRRLFVAWWVEFGEHGARKPKPPGHGWRIFGGTTCLVLIGIGAFATIRQFAEPYHPGLTREWQEATNEQLRRHFSDPITGVASEVRKTNCIFRPSVSLHVSALLAASGRRYKGYKGKGAVFVSRSEKDL